MTTVLYALTVERDAEIEGELAACDDTDERLCPRALQRCCARGLRGVYEAGATTPAPYCSHLTVSDTKPRKTRLRYRRRIAVTLETWKGPVLAFFVPCRLSQREHHGCTTFERLTVQRASSSHDPREQPTAYRCGTEPPPTWWMVDLVRMPRVQALGLALSGSHLLMPRKEFLPGPVLYQLQQERGMVLWNTVMCYSWNENPPLV